MPQSATTPEPKPDISDYFAGAETTTVYLDPDRRDVAPSQRLWVRLLNELDYGQVNELENAAIRGMEIEAVRDAADGKRLILPDLNRQRLLKMALYIDDWSLPHPWPDRTDARVKVCARLKPRVAALIMAEIERLEAEAAGQATAENGEDAGPKLRSLPSQPSPAPESAEKSS